MKTKLSKKERTREMTIIAMFIAIIALLGLVPSGLGSSTLGFIKIAPNIEATIIHIPVLIGAVLLGRKMGLYLGLAFGVIANIAAFIYASPFFVYPWVAIIPRLIFGLLIYDVTRLFLKFIKNKYLGVAVSFFVLTIIHTLLVLALLWTSFTMVMEYESLGAAFKPYLAFLVLYNIPLASVIEAALAAVIGGTVVIRLAQFLNKEEYLNKEEIKG